MTFTADTPTTRGLVTEALAERGYPLAGTVVDDLGGGGTLVQSARGTVACRVDILSGEEGLLAQRVSDRSTHLLTLPAGTELTGSETFVVIGRGTFEVTAVREHTNELARFAELVKRT